MMKFKNILVIRSATRILDSTIDSLKTEFPESKITVLAPESASNVLIKQPKIDFFISTGHKTRMSIFSLSKSVIKKIRRTKDSLRNATAS